MLTILRRVALALALVLPTVAYAVPVDDVPAAPPPYDEVVKVVRSTGGHGTGFILNDHLVVTASHVVKGESFVTLVLSDGSEVDASVVVYDELADVAVVRTRRPLDRVSVVRCAAPTLGEHIRAVGWMLGLGRVETLGVVAGNPVEVGHWYAAVPVALAGGKGMSGGPVYDDAGNVVGIVVAGVQSPFGVGVMLMVPATEVCRVARI